MHVADKIFEKLIVNFLLPRGKTVLMATSQHRFFSMFSQANILEIENGVVQLNDSLQKHTTEKTQGNRNPINDLI